MPRAFAVGGFLCLFTLPFSVSAETAETPKEPAPTVHYIPGKGLHIDAGEPFALNVQHRLQFRHAYPFDGDPRTEEELAAEGHSFLVRRARLRLNGHAYKDWLRFNLQYDWVQPVLRDFWLDAVWSPQLTLRAGRMKVLYNDERVASSGRQQMVNRSILNDVFTIDRQQGLQLQGRLFNRSAADLSYAVGIFTGRGIGERLNDDRHPMYAVRLQWNMVGDPIDFTQSDYELTPRWQLNMAFAAATNRSNCTAFETDARSCRRLPGSDYPDPQSQAGSRPGMFRMNQAVWEVRSLYRGFYYKHELHAKRIEDMVGSAGPWPRLRELWGFLIQMGFFPHTLWEGFPRSIELAGRYALYDPDAARGSDRQQEITATINWFFHGHSNKLTAEVTHHILEFPAARSSAQRYRLQWEFLF